MRDRASGGRALARSDRYDASAMTFIALSHLAMVRYHLAMGEPESAWTYAVHAMSYKRMASSARRRARGDYR